jgi:hypothetical protein
MNRKQSIAGVLLLGAALVVAPSLDNLGTGHVYDQAQAAKGGNGKGRGGGGPGGPGGGNAGGNQSTGAGTEVDLASNPLKGSEKVTAKELALSDPTVPAHPSMLGRWNAAKPIDHPAIQAHIRNGKFNGTIGMVAAYAYAQTTFNNMEADLAAAQALLGSTDPAALQGALAAALQAAGYGDPAAFDAAAALQEYNNAVAIDSTVADPAVQSALDAIEAYDAAAATVAAGEQALDNLATAEANMEAYSNRSAWSEIRDDVRTKMGLDPTENDLVAPVTP